MQKFSIYLSASIITVKRVSLRYHKQKDYASYDNNKLLQNLKIGIYYELQ